MPRDYPPTLAELTYISIFIIYIATNKESQFRPFGLANACTLQPKLHTVGVPNRGTQQPSEFFPIRNVLTLPLKESMRCYPPAAVDAYPSAIRFN